MFQKLPKKFHGKAVLSNILWLHLNKIDKHFTISTYTREPFTFMRRAQNAGTHALKQHRLSENSSPPPPTPLRCIKKQTNNITEYRIWHASWAQKRHMGEKLCFQTTKMWKCKQTFALFLCEFSRLVSEAISCSLTCSRHSPPPPLFF